jgi:hypothetical protein
MGEFRGMAVGPRNKPRSLAAPVASRATIRLRVDALAFAPHGSAESCGLTVRTASAVSWLLPTGAYGLFASSRFGHEHRFRQISSMPAMQRKLPPPARVGSDASKPESGRWS